MTEDELLPISGLQHLLFCERQCALIHVEGVWRENMLTAEGRVLHETVDEGDRTGRGGVKIERDVGLRSEHLGLYGRADVVEFRSGPDEGPRPYPVEYKRGRRAARTADDVQLCAQAMCLEEMLEVSVPEGAIFHGTSKRRRVVALTEELRQLTASSASRFHAMVRQRTTPRAALQAKCRSCSLLELCQPGVTAAVGAATNYVRRLAGGDL